MLSGISFLLSPWTLTKLFLLESMIRYLGWGFHEVLSCCHGMMGFPCLCLRRCELFHSFGSEVIWWLTQVQRTFKVSAKLRKVKCLHHTAVFKNNDTIRWLFTRATTSTTSEMEEFLGIQNKVSAVEKEMAAMVETALCVTYFCNWSPIWTRDKNSDSSQGCGQCWFKYWSALEMKVQSTTFK